MVLAMMMMMMMMVVVVVVMMAAVVMCLCVGWIYGVLNKINSLGPKSNQVVQNILDTERAHVSELQVGETQL